MRHFEAGNRVRAPPASSTADASSGASDQLIAATPPGYRDRQPGPRRRRRNSVLIVGMPRSGNHPYKSRSCRAIRTSGREANWRSGACAIRPARRCSPSPDPQATRRLAGGYLKTLRAFGPDARRITDKTPIISSDFASSAAFSPCHGSPLPPPSDRQRLINLYDEHGHDLRLSRASGRSGVLPPAVSAGMAHWREGCHRIGLSRWIRGAGRRSRAPRKAHGRRLRPRVE